MSAGRYPRPVLVSAQVARWLAEECESALAAMIAARSEPKPPSRCGRKRGASAAKITAAAKEAASATEE